MFIAFSSFGLREELVWPLVGKFLLLGGVGSLLLSLGFYSGVDCGIAGFFGNVIYVSEFF